MLQFLPFFTFFRTGPSSDTALLGAYNLDLAQEPERQSYKIKQAYRHPNFTWIHSPFE